MYTDHFDTLVYWDNHKDICGHAAEYTLKACNAYSKRTLLLLLLEHGTFS
jgi:hypothetical protein